jgi:DNA topoisomerase-1
MSLDTIGLEDALRLLQLPRVVGVAPDGEEITARNGRYGPYVQKGKESRSLETEEQLFTISTEEAVALLSQPRQRRGQRAPTKPLRELGADPVGGKEIVLKEGRFGPYVTDGETNASLRKGDDPETVTLERAVELLAERRAKGPAKRTNRRRKAS